MTVVNHVLLDLEDAPIVGAYVEVRLLAPTELDGAFNGDGSQYISRVVSRTNGSGAVSFDLVPTTSITPSNSVYQAIFRVHGVPTTSLFFTAPSSGPVNLADHLTSPPTSLPFFSAANIVFVPGDGVTSNNVEDAIKEAYNNGGGGGGSFPTYYQQGAPESPADGETWIRPVTFDGADSYPNRYGVGMFRYNEGSTTWFPISPVALDTDTGEVLGLVTVGADGNIVIERFDGDGNALAGVAVYAGGVYCFANAGSEIDFFGPHSSIFMGNQGTQIDDDLLWGRFFAPNYTGTFDSENAYPLGSVVQDSGELYIANCDVDAGSATTDNGWRFIEHGPEVGKQFVLRGDTNPSDEAIPAPLGTLYLYAVGGTTAELWQKTGTAADAWEAAGSGGGVTNPYAQDLVVTGDGSAGITSDEPRVVLGVEVGGNNNAHFEVASPVGGVAYADFTVVGSDASARVGWHDTDSEFRIETGGHSLGIGSSGALTYDGETITVVKPFMKNTWSAPDDEWVTDDNNPGMDLTSSVGWGTFTPIVTGYAWMQLAAEIHWNDDGAQPPALDFLNFMSAHGYDSMMQEGGQPFGSWGGTLGGSSGQNGFLTCQSSLGNTLGFYNSDLTVAAVPVTGDVCTLTINLLVFHS